MILAVLLASGIMAYVVYQDALLSDGNRDRAVAWALGTLFAGLVIPFLGGLIVLIVYFAAGRGGHALSMGLDCEVCGKSNLPQARICQYCGEPLRRDRRYRICPDCHRSFDEESRFCPFCEVELQDWTPPTPAGNIHFRTCPACGARNMNHREDCWQCETPFDKGVSELLSDIKETPAGK